MSANEIVIETPRLVLRAAREDDATPLYKIFSDPDVMRYWSEPPHPRPTRTEAWLSSMIKSPQNGVTDFIICLKQPLTSTTTMPAPPPLIGKIGIYSPHPFNEIGFLLSRDHWGKGLAREALTHILDHLFSLKALSHSLPPNNDDIPNPIASQAERLTTLSFGELPSEWRYPSITADTDPRNNQSIGLLKKCGFEVSEYVERTWEISGEWVDSLYLRLGREDWLQSKGEGQ